MERRRFVAIVGGAAIVPSSARGKLSHSVQDRLVGTWSFVSSVNLRNDGSSFDRWGPNAKGTLMFDRAGHYAQIIIGSESRVFGAKSFSAFGTYSVHEDTMLLTRIEGSSIAKLNNTVQRRVIILLTANELKYLNQATTSGTKAEVLWKRVTE